MPVTPNIALNLPPIGSNNWGGPLNFNFSVIDKLLSGINPIPALAVTGNVTIGGSVTAGSFVQFTMMVTRCALSSPLASPWGAAGASIALTTTE